MSVQQSGDAAAFAGLYAQHYRLVRAFVARRVGADDADEVTAEVFLVAWRRWPDVGERGLPWLYTTARHAVSSHLRGVHRYDRALQHLASVARSAPDEAVEASADRVTAARALLSLSAADRDLLLAVGWDGLTVPELAGVLGCSTPTAHVRLHRARRRLDAATRAHELRADPHTDPTMEPSR